MVNVVVLLWQGVIQDVAVYKDEADAFAFWEEETGVPYEEFKERAKTDDSEDILGDYAGSNIWELSIK